MSPAICTEFCDKVSVELVFLDRSEAKTAPNTRLQSYPNLAVTLRWFSLVACQQSVNKRNVPLFHFKCFGNILLMGAPVKALYALWPKQHIDSLTGGGRLA